MRKPENSLEIEIHKINWRQGLDLINKNKISRYLVDFTVLFDYILIVKEGKLRDK